MQGHRHGLVGRLRVPAQFSRYLAMSNSAYQCSRRSPGSLHNNISGLGPVAAVGIAVGLIAMITLLPAILVIFGRWIFWPVRPGFGSAEPSSRGFWSRVGQPSAAAPARCGW